MSALSLLLVGRLLLLTVEEPPRTGEVILFLMPAEPDGLQNGLQIRSLLDTVAIYTRDLQIRVQTVPPGPSASPSHEQVRALLRARGARLAFWCATAPDRRSMTVYSQDSGGVLRRDVVEGKEPGTADLQRAVGLKLRAILAGILAGDDGRASPSAGQPSAIPTEGKETPAPPASGRRSTLEKAIAPAPADADPTAVVPTPDKREVDSPRPAAPVVGADTAPSPVSPPAYPLGPGSAIGVGYGVSQAPGHTSLRHALAVRGMTSVGPSIELMLGLDVAGADNQTLPSGTLSLYDIPVRIGGRWVHRGASFLGGVGVFGGCHFLSASAVSIDGRRDQTLTWAGGFGLEALARGVSVGRFSLELRGWIEGVLPRTRFLVGDSPAVQTGFWAVGTALGVTVSTR